MSAYAGTGWSLLPALLAILLAVLTRQVYFSLAVAVAAGAFLVTGLDPVATGRVLATHYLIAPFTGFDKLKLLLFTVLLGAAVGVMNASGGTRGMVGKLVRYASTRAKAQVMAGVAGLLIFFDDYANILILGPTFLPVFDRLGLSRAKLAYIADSTGAADASLALVSTWIGFELGLIGDALKSLPDPALSSLSPYALFVTSIPYRFYLHLATALIFIIAIMGRDFGPMLASERAALRRRRHAPADRSRIAHWTVGAIPIALLVVVTCWQIYASGHAKLAAAGKAVGAGVREIVAAADSYQAMLLASLVTLAAALALAMGPGRFRGRPLLRAVGKGMWVMAPPLLILVLAWALGDLCRDLKTGEYVGRAMGETVKPWMLSTVVFGIACTMSFATGTSWGTMAVLMPVAVPLAHASVVAAGLPANGAQFHLMLTIAAVLAGAVFGDHCGLISDTTILAAIASRCSLWEHFTTQVPYAVLAAVITVAAGTLPSSVGVPWWICLPTGLLVLILAVRLLGQRVQ